VSSSQKMTGTDMMRPSVMKLGILMFKGGLNVGWWTGGSLPEARLEPDRVLDGRKPSGWAAVPSRAIAP
jgi:hypothetical protein